MRPSPSVGSKLGCRVACHHLHAELIVPSFLSNDRNVITSKDQSAVPRKLDTAYIFGLAACVAIFVQPYTQRFKNLPRK
jgi:hypothetical protein